MDQTALFCCDHFGALAQCMALTSACQRVILLISTEEAEQREVLLRLRQASLLEVVYFDYRICCELSNGEGVKGCLLAYFDGILAENGIDIARMDKVYISNSGAYCPFEIYAVLRGRRYALVEFANDEFITGKLLLSLGQYAHISSAYKEVVYALGCVIGNNSLAEEHVYVKGSRLNKGMAGSSTSLDLADALRNLKPKRREAILAAYPEMRGRMPKEGAVIMLPNSESLTRKALKDHAGYAANLIAPYTLLADLLVEDGMRLLIKPHPHGHFEFPLYFPEAGILPKAFPVEFLYLMGDVRIARVVSIETSATCKIQSMIDEDIQMTRVFMLELPRMIPIYCVIRACGTAGIHHPILVIPEGRNYEGIVQRFCAQLNVPAACRPELRSTCDDQAGDSVCFLLDSGGSATGRAQEVLLSREACSPRATLVPGVDRIRILGRVTEALQRAFDFELGLTHSLARVRAFWQEEEL